MSRTKYRRERLAVAAAAVVASFMAQEAGAATIDQTATIANAPSDWTSSFTFDKFDPAQGTLTGVQLQVDSNIVSNITVESRELAPSAFTANVGGTVNVIGLNNALMVSTAPSAFTAANLGASDGTLDFGGNSGRTISGVSGTSSATTSGVLTPSQQAAFTGPGTITLPVTAQVRASENGPANLVGRFNTQVGATGNLSYSFTAPGQNNGGNYGSGVTIIGGGSFSIFPVDALTTATQTVNIANQTTGWNTTAAFQKFDASLGQLFSVNIKLTSTMNADRGFENLGSTSTWITTDQEANITLSLLDNETLVSLFNKLTGTVNLAGFDGVEDFAGASGKTVEDLTATQSTSGQITDADALLDFIGDGLIDLGVSSKGKSFLEGPGNMLFQLAADAGAKIELSYTYIPGQNTALVAVPEPGPLALLMFPLAGMAFMRRRKPD